MVARKVAHSVDVKAEWMAATSAVQMALRWAERTVP
jgi:hypothetical protein